MFWIADLSVTGEHGGKCSPFELWEASFTGMCAHRPAQSRAV
jgi:hypothetical protein